MAEPKDWRPENWDKLKDKILRKAEIMDSRIADKLMEETASEILGAYDDEQFMEDAKEASTKSHKVLE